MTKKDLMELATSLTTDELEEITDRAERIVKRMVKSAAWLQDMVVKEKYGPDADTQSYAFEFDGEAIALILPHMAEIVRGTLDSIQLLREAPMSAEERETFLTAWEKGVKNTAFMAVQHALVPQHELSDEVRETLRKKGVAMKDQPRENQPDVTTAQRGNGTIH